MSNLRKIRQAIGLSQGELGEMVGQSQSSIGHYEKGRRIPSLSTCRALVNALNKLGAKAKFDDVFPA